MNDSLPKYYETRFLVSEWGVWRNSKELGADSACEGNVTQNKIKLFGCLADQLEKLNALGWQVISSVPIEQGAFYGTGLMNNALNSASWGGGYGYGASATAGICLILQRPINDFGSSPALARQHGYRAELKRHQLAWEIRYTPITQKVPKGNIFAKTLTKYIFAEQEFGRLDEAEAFRESVAMDMEQGKV